MAYYHDQITEASWQELTKLHTVCDFVLLGGWAVYLYTQGLKSKDIDILIDYDAIPKIQTAFNFYKNDRLKKYEAVKGSVQIDIYLPHYSELGIPVEDLLQQSQIIQGFRVVRPEYLVALKLFTHSIRGRSPKGRKDFLDLISLYLSLGDSIFQTAIALTHQYHLDESFDFFVALLAENTHLPELNLASHQYAKLKKSLLRLASFG